MAEPLAVEERSELSLDLHRGGPVVLDLLTLASSHAKATRPPGPLSGGRASSPARMLFARQKPAPPVAMIARETGPGVVSMWASPPMNALPM